MLTKLCPDCKEEYPLTTKYFGSNGRTSSGKQKFKAACHSCTSKRQYTLWVQKITNIVGEGNLRCWECGYDRYIGAMEFHHLDPTQKDMQISKMRNYSQSRLAEEVNKCVILCGICHPEAHAGLVDINKLQYNPRAGVV